MIANSLRKRRALAIPPKPDEIADIVMMMNPLDLLIDNRSGIELRGHIMAGGANELHTSLIGLVIWLRAFESGKK